MKTMLTSHFLSVLSLALFTFIGCKKSGSGDRVEAVPILKVGGAYAVSSTSIEVSGVVTNNVSWTETGVYYMVAASGETEHYIPVTTAPQQEIHGTITGLTPNTVYFVGVYAKNSGGKGEAGYSNSVQTPSK
ncbi:fibronectin type III domain-containing protein [Mucilaginibacter sp. BJC16-A38]|uniref:fibronectin type III domain-containing protein n=1 Tax=Mucilaginibacter phenanthrenivorans TaxID=1234842 RepID=UPI0021570B2E|nr:fibronectin type III domain-containing protein [Mucilaginibacter phenanthrenivorans]MCR8559276.1 fibronectin type III domain-containing protein [Mucilaginibacter phenanthrenivorans]